MSFKGSAPPVLPRLLAAWVLAAAFASTAAAAAASPATAPRALTVDDYFRLGDVGTPRISPDGEWIAFPVTTRDRERDEAETRVWRIPAAGGEAAAMTAPGASATSPRWSPDGRWLSFLAARDGCETQVWALDRRGGEAVALTAVLQGVSAYEWAPDGRRLVLVIHDPKPSTAAGRSADETAAAETAAGGCGEPEGAEKAKTPPPWVIDRLQFKEDGTGYLDRRRDHLWLLDLGGGGAPGEPAVPAKPVQLTFGDYDDSEPAWSPDGRSIVFVSNRGEEPDATYDTDLWRVAAEPPAAGTETRTEPPLTRLTDHPGADYSPAWSPDGRWIAYLATPEPQWLDYAGQALAVVPAEGGAPRTLVADGALTSPRFGPGSSWLYYIAEHRGEQRLERMAVGDGGATVARPPVETLVGGRQVVYAFEPGPAGVALTLAEPGRPAEVHLWREGGGAGEAAGDPAAPSLRRLSAVNDRALEGIELGAVESFDATGPDGTIVQSFLVRPPAAAGPPPWPAVLWLHGGPQEQHDWGFDFEAQLFAARGWLVILPNPRGSTGRGQEFTLGIWRRWGDPDSVDVLAAVDRAVALGLADPERLGVGGWSYGGMLTNLLITRTGRFAAAISGASATLYAANYGHDIYQRWWEGELGLPWEPANRGLWETLSPFYRLDRVTTPTLILCGERDWNVPALNSEQLYLALRRIGKAETSLVIYPGEAHSLGVPSYEKDRYERFLGWFGRFLDPADPP